MFGSRRSRSTQIAAMSLAIVVILCPIIVQGGELTGTVTDRSDGTGLFRATVTVRPDNPDSQIRHAAADENGKYEIADIIPGTYFVTVSYVGFVTHEVRDVTISDGEQYLLDATLIPSAINIDAISVTASRRPEKLLEAPASVSMVNSENIKERASLNPTEHVKGLPAVDVASTGLSQSSVVVRGFNDIFSGALLVLTDNRIARVPSLRFNAHNFITTTNEDIDRIEIVSGPGSALYGPNSASGVMHILTKSPFGSEGTSVSLGSGERDLLLGSFRHAGTVNDRVGYKFTGQYYQGTDWKSEDPLEDSVIQLFRPTAAGREYEGEPFVNERNFDIEKMSADARIDFLLDENTTLIVNGGFNQATSIELTGLGAGQAIDWRYMFGQARLMYKDLFVQGFVNSSDAGDTYLLRTGQLIVDKSKLFGVQVQHSYSPSEAISMTYGVDGLFTRPNTEATINGRNEDNDNITELGVYVQSEARASDQVKLLGAIRVDDHNRLEDMIFSPRAAVVYQPAVDHNLRFTYNRAYSTPDNNNLYLDILQNKDPFGIGAAFAPSFGFSPDIDIRVQGVPESGFHWSINENGPQFRSSFAPAIGRTTSDFIDFNDPIFTNFMWSAGSGAVMSGFEAQLYANGLSETEVDGLTGAVEAVVPATVSGVENVMRTFNPNTESFDLTTQAELADIDRLEPTITQTFEFGYKAMLGKRLKVAADFYRTKKNNFVGPLTVETPNVFLDPATLQAYLGTEIGTAYATAGAGHQAVLDMLDDVTMGGNGDGSPVDEIVAMYVSGSAGIPFGTVSPEEMLDPDAVLVTYRNFGDITFYGADFAFDYHLNHAWNVGGTYSFVSKNVFEKDANQVNDIYLNSPKHKFSVHMGYTNPEYGFGAQSRIRFTDGFRMSSPYVGTKVDPYAVLDLDIGKDLIYDTRLSLTIQNLLDNRHVEFIGAPEVGRLVIGRISTTF